MKSDQIRILSSEGKSPTQIAAELGVRRDYVYKILSHDGDANTIKGLMKTIINQNKEIISNQRLLLGEERHPIRRALQRLG